MVPDVKLASAALFSAGEGLLFGEDFGEEVAVVPYPGYYVGCFEGEAGGAGGGGFYFLPGDRG